MQCYALTLGARNTPAAGRHFSRTDDEAIRSITEQHFPEGFTILNAQGGWWDVARKKFRKEDSRQIIVRSPSARRVRVWARALGHCLGQKELLVAVLGPSLMIKCRGGAR